MEMAAAQEMVKIAYELKPDICTLVPERREELTTEGGLDVVSGRDLVRKVVKTLRDAEILTSLFIDADLDQVKAAHRVEAEVIEIHTGRYCDARLASDRRRELARIVDAAKAATKLGLKVAAGHGINYQNVLPLAAISEIEEFNIGHSIVARALLVGM
jgi:pyridoxine 5-phosphate synthase